jgi:hypothetical protein
MIDATREKMRLWLLLLIGVVATLLGQTHAREIFTPSPPESGIFATQTQASTGQNYDGIQYDALDSLLAANGGGATWNNGWRTANGKFASPNGAGRGGAAAEQSVWDAVNHKPGWSVIEGQVGVRNASGQLRYYDGAAVSPRGRVIGLETKSGTATKTPAQHVFDSGVNTQNPAIGVGQNQGLEVGRALEIRR